jgi:plasmid stabilization system protein ParE
MDSEPSPASEREAAADARADADVAEGRLIHHEAVRHWVFSWINGVRYPRPLVSKTPIRLNHVVWTEEAVVHVEAILQRLYVSHPRMGEIVAKALFYCAQDLANFTERGSDVGGGRLERPAQWPYVLRYLLRHDVIVILRIRNGRDGDPE